MAKKSGKGRHISKKAIIPALLSALITLDMSLANQFQGFLSILFVVFLGIFVVILLTHLFFSNSNSIPYKVFYIYIAVLFCFLILVGLAHFYNTLKDDSKDQPEPTDPIVEDEPQTKPPTSTATLPPLSSIFHEGQYLHFGEYSQNKYDKEPILWIVLAVHNDDLMLISKDVLDAQVFGSTNEWQLSFLRNWLNSKFKDTAFPTHQSDLRRDSLGDYVLS